MRVEFRGEVRVEPIQDGVYLVTWWNLPCPKSKRERQQKALDARWEAAKSDKILARLQDGADW